MNAACHARASQQVGRPERAAENVLAHLRVFRPGALGHFHPLGQISGRAVFQAQRRGAAVALHRLYGYCGPAVHRFLRAFAVALPAGSIALIVLSGVLYMGGLLFYLRAIQSEEASVVAPFFQAAPLFGYVLAYFVLGERLSAMQMAGGGMIIAGTLIVSIRFDRSVRVFKARLVLLMLSCGLAMALSGLIFKIFALRVDFWATTFWLFVGEAIFGGALLTIGPYRRQFVAVLRKDTAALITISGSNELFNLGGTVGTRYALLFAPLSIVQAIGATTTLFVFAFGIALSVFYPRLAGKVVGWRVGAKSGRGGAGRDRGRAGDKLNAENGPASLFLVAGNAELGDGFLQVIGQQRYSQRVVGRTPIGGAAERTLSIWPRAFDKWRATNGKGPRPASRFRVALAATLPSGVLSVVKAERTDGETWPPRPTGPSVPSDRRR